MSWQRVCNQVPMTTSLMVIFYLAMVANMLRGASYCKIAGLIPHDQQMTGPLEDYTARVQRVGGMIPGFDGNSGWRDDWQHMEPIGDEPLPQWPMISHRYCCGPLQRFRESAHVWGRLCVVLC